MAGEIVAVGADVTGWQAGDRVCANFSTEHIYGPTNPRIQNASMGGQAHGVLTQYRTFPAHVRRFPSMMLKISNVEGLVTLVSRRNSGPSFI